MSEPSAELESCAGRQYRAIRTTSGWCGSRRGGTRAGADVKQVDLRDYALPLFDEDLEKEPGMPPAGQRLKALFRESDGFLIARPSTTARSRPC